MQLGASEAGVQAVAAVVGPALAAAFRIGFEQGTVSREYVLSPEPVLT